MLIRFRPVNSFTFDDLIRWSRDLPRWQRDALRRVLSQDSVSLQDIVELAELAKAPYVPTAKSQIKATSASLSHAQATPAQTSTVRLVSVRNIQHVNALGEGPVPFGGKDLVIIYGGNASGKSGIARILKKCCRARDPGGEVLSNVFEPPTTELAAVTIDFQVEDKDSTYEWTLGGPVCPDLLSVNTFDSMRECTSRKVKSRSLHPRNTEGL